MAGFCVAVLAAASTVEALRVAEVIDAILPVEEAPVPLEPVSVKAVPVEEAPAPVEAVPVEEAPAPVEAVPVEEAPAPVEAVPVEEAPAPVEAVPVEEAPVPVEAVPMEEAPAPVEAVPVEEALAPVEAVPVEEAAAPVEAVQLEEAPAPVEVEALAPVEAAPLEEATPSEVIAAEAASAEAEASVDGSPEPSGLVSAVAPAGDVDSPVSEETQANEPKREYIVVVLEGAPKSEKNPKVLGVGPATGRLIPGPDDDAPSEVSGEFICHRNT